MLNFQVSPQKHLFSQAEPHQPGLQWQPGFHWYLSLLSFYQNHPLKALCYSIPELLSKFFLQTSSLPPFLFKDRVSLHSLGWPGLTMQTKLTWNSTSQVGLKTHPTYLFTCIETKCLLRHGVCFLQWRENPRLYFNSKGCSSVLFCFEIRLLLFFFKCS